MSQLDDILKNIDENHLEQLIKEIKRTHEYEILEQKTQMKNSAIEGDKDYDVSLTNRQTHTFQVSEIAYEMVKTSGRSEKEALVAELVGLCHDLGHPPFGHDGELMITEKTGKSFYHARYGAKVFDKLFNRVLNSKQKRNGKDVFSHETKESLEELQSFVKAGIFLEEIIQNLSGLGDYIKSGVNYHQDGYYTFEIDRKIEQLRKDQKNNGKFNEELDLLEKAFENPCIQAGMLADTVAFMQSDVRDMLNTKNPFDENKTIISIEDQMKIAKDIDFSKINILKMQEQLGLSGMENLEVDESLRQIIEAIGTMDIRQNQIIIARQIGEQGLNEKGRFESVSDEYKMFADDFKEKYEEFIGQKLTNEKWVEIRDKGLREQRNLLKEKNPLLCLNYEIQNELIYKKIFQRDNTKILNNDLIRNKAIFDRTYDYLYEITSSKLTELTNQKEIDIKDEMNKVFKTKSYPKQFDEIGQDRRISQTEIVKNLVIWKIHQMGNNGLKAFYNEYLAEQENSILSKIDKMEQDGKTEEEIVNQLGIDKISYTGFKWRDSKKKDDIEKARQEGKTDEEIALSLQLEKREFDEINENKSAIRRYVEYSMTFKEMKEINENLKNLEMENETDEIFNENNIDVLDSIIEFDEIAEMHDQKSNQFFEDIESGKYNVSPPYDTKRQEGTEVPELSSEDEENNRNINGSVQDGLSLVETKNNGIKTFFKNIINRIKESNFVKNIMNKSENSPIEEDTVNQATAKLENMKKNFEDNIIVSKEEQEKNRIEYENRKTKSISKENREEEEFEH